MKRFLLLLSLFTFGITIAQTIDLEQYASGFTTPTDMANAGDERLFIVEQYGRIKIIDASGTTLATDFLDIRTAVASPEDSNPVYEDELGLLGLAFHPDYATNGYFYVNYTENTGGSNYRTVISRFTVSSDPNVADETSEFEIMSIPQPYSNHNGGGLVFGPDGYLYIGTGDGGSAGDPQNRAQNGQSLLGKMLRIDVDGGSPYAIPASNPFVGDATVLDEVWALGLRNPWRYDFDNETGDLWIADVGQNAREEVNIQAASSTGGENYGWKCYEGFITYDNTGCGPAGDYVEPEFDYPHSGMASGLSITGGKMYRGCEYPGMQGCYMFIDYVSGDFWTLKDDGTGNYVSTFQNNLETSIVGFGEDINSEVYCLKRTGVVYKVVETDTGEATDPVISNSNDVLSTTDTGDSYQWLSDGAEIGGETNPNFTPTVSGNYSLVISKGNCDYYSNTIVVNLSPTGILNLDRHLSLNILPNPSNGNFNILMPSNESELDLSIYDISGKLVYIEKGFKTDQLNVENLNSGIYILKASGTHDYFTKLNIF